MTTLTTGRRDVVEIVSDIAKSDEGTALLMVEMITYDALCEEVDRIQPFLDRDVSRVMAKRAEGALEHVAKRYAISKSAAERAELEDLAGTLMQIVTVSKDTDDNPQTPWWDARNDDGTFRARGLRGQVMRRLAGSKPSTQHPRGVVGALNLFGPEDAQTKQALGQGFSRIKDSDRYSTARALGQGLQGVSQPHARAAGELLRMVGDIGPEAQQVFGRGLTRLAYRYRGTERRPNPQYNEVTQAMTRRAVAQAQEANQPTDQARLRAVADAGAGFLYPQVPDQELANLSLKAGKMPPSRGIIFDAAGHPTSESVGFNGDHYLPFDLKNLKRLRGGQYVRTRTTGGLTDEDIYTGLLTGARQVTVVSNSGVFSIEFDPSLRGGRRYSDKARQMVDRYASLLATIKEGEKNELLINDLSPREKAHLRQEAAGRAKGNKLLADQYYDDALEKERFTRRNQSLDDEELMDEARSQARTEMARQQRAGEVKGVSARTLAQRTRDIFEQKKSEQQSQLVRYYRLDAQGYKAAQDALAQEFPYFIRSKQMLPLDEWLRRTNRLRPEDPLPPRPGVDIGYTRRGELAPGGARTAPAREGQERTEQRQQPGFSQALRAETPTAAESATWHDALADPGRHADLARLLDRSLSYRSRITEGMEGPMSLNDPDEEALANGSAGYSLWILHSKRSPRGVADFLLNPETPEEHIDKTIDSLRLIRDELPEGSAAYSKADADKAIEQLEQAKMLRRPFAEPAPETVYAEPTAGPQPFDDITKLVGNAQALRDYADANPEIARQATAYLGKDGEEKAKSSISGDLRVTRSIARWPKDANGLVDPDRPPAGVRISADDANLFIRDRDNSQLHQDLERKQKGWALAQAARLTAAIDGTEVPELGPKEEVAHRAPLSSSRLVARPRSSVRKSRSASPPPSSPSFLDDVIAARLASDPEYLSRLLSSHM